PRVGQVQATVAHRSVASDAGALHGVGRLPTIEDARVPSSVRNRACPCTLQTWGPLPGRPIVNPERRSPTWAPCAPWDGCRCWSFANRARSSPTWARCAALVDCHCQPRLRIGRVALPRRRTQHVGRLPLLVVLESSA